VRGDAYYQLLDEFLTAVRRRYGNTTLIHFNDMAYDNAAKLLNMYRTDFPCFSDELQVRLATACRMVCLLHYAIIVFCVGSSAFQCMSASER
jgi:malic enzyme